MQNVQDFQYPIRHLQLVIVIVKKSKVEKIRINGDYVRFSSKKNESLINHLSLKWENSKVLMGGELFYFN
jgi:hypothetical protein